MNKVIVVEEECHGFIGIVDKAENIIDFLCDCHWLDESSEICVEREHPTDDNLYEWKTLSSLYGENWKQVLQSFPLAILENFFEGDFYFREEEIYTKEK